VAGKLAVEMVMVDSLVDDWEVAAELIVVTKAVDEMSVDLKD